MFSVLIYFWGIISSHTAFSKSTINKVMGCVRAAEPPAHTPFPPYFEKVLSVHIFIVQTMRGHATMITNIHSGLISRIWQGTRKILLPTSKNYNQPFLLVEENPCKHEPTPRFIKP